MSSHFLKSVSYTHLDVYKRQNIYRLFPADTKKHLNLSIKMYQYQDQTVSQQDVLKKIFLISSNGVFNSLKQELDNLYENNDILT